MKVYSSDASRPVISPLPSSSVPWKKSKNAAWTCFSEVTRFHAPMKLEAFTGVPSENLRSLWSLMVHTVLSSLGSMDSATSRTVLPLLS